MLIYGRKQHNIDSVQIISVGQLCPTLRSHGLQHARLPCPSPRPRACSNSCPFSWWWHPTISPSAKPFCSCPQSSSSGSFLMTQFFASGGQIIRASPSASALPMKIQNWFPLLLWTPCSPRDPQESSVIPSSRASILWRSAFFMVQLSHSCMTTGKTIDLISQTFVGKGMSLPFDMLCRLVIKEMETTPVFLPGKP